MGRKGPYTAIVPLCHYDHDELHRVGVIAFEDWSGLDLMAEAAQVEAAWLTYSGTTHSEGER